MALRGAFRVTELYNDLDDVTVNNIKLGFNATILVFGNDWGDLVEPRYGQNFYNIDPTSITFEADMAAAVKADIMTHGISFGIGDIDTVIRI